VSRPNAELLKICELQLAATQRLEQIAGRLGSLEA
jgi:hypothetical protein